MIRLDELKKIIGLSASPVSHQEKLVSALGGFIAILSVFFISEWLVGMPAAAIIVASMGASTVLLFAVPHGPMSQPWPVFAGHIISALTGVICAKWINHEILAASLAVGLAVGFMYYLHCIHPPGGATALSAVVGGDAVTELGFQFVLTPILINVLIILSVAIAFNWFFKWRRYPAYWHRVSLKRTQDEPLAQGESIRHEDFVYALSQLDSFIDVNEYDLLKIYDLAMHRSQSDVLPLNSITIGSCYSNGEYGEYWSVRQVVDASLDDSTDGGMIIFKVVAGKGRRQSGYTSAAEFIRWAKHQVNRDEENWKRVE